MSEVEKLVATDDGRIAADWLSNNWPLPWTYTDADALIVKSLMRTLAAVRAEEREWRPIDTFDMGYGEYVLVSGGTWGHSDYEDEMSSIEIACLTLDGWESGYVEYSNERYWHKPTHWRPLPEPPSLHEAQRGSE